MAGILIVDDMPLIRSTLVRALKQNGRLFAPVLEACNGDEAVALALSQKPDVILMDIKMPGLSGLQALAAIRRELPGVKVVMLTAYNEFAYVQKALKLGARDYVLKPVRPERLLDLLQEIKDEIEEERREQRTIGLVKDSLQKTLPVIENNLVETLIRDPSPEGTMVEESLNYLGKRLTWPAVLVAKVDAYEQFVQGRPAEELQRLFNALTKLVRERMPDPHAALVGYSNPGRVIAIISTQNAPSTSAQFRTLAEELRGAIAAQMPFTVTIGLGKRHMDMESIPISYAEANLARRYHGRAPGNQVVALDDPAGPVSHTADASRFLVQKERELVKWVEARRWPEARQLISEITDYLAQRHHQHPEAMKNHCAELVTLVAWGVISSGAEESQVLDVLHQQVHALSSWNTLPEMRSWTLHSLAEMVAQVPTELPQETAVQTAISYIRHNYQRSELSLSEVADVVSLSTSHFGAQFKAKTDMSYVQFVTAVRIDEARKLLLSSDYSVNAISEMVGYPNATNFYRHFRRHTGTTPAAYRDAHQQR